MDHGLDETSIHQLQEELHTEIYPGTEIMTDVGSHHFVKAGSGSHIILVPQPSDNEHDPLNWSPFWKGMTMSAACFTSFTQGLGPLSLAPMFGDYVVAFDSTLPDVIQFTGVAILVLGFSNFLWVPLQTCFGRRPVLILSTSICLAASIWRAKATTYGSFMGACVLNGIGAGPAETAQATITADVIFLHDRGKWNTLYFATYFGSLLIGPIIAGPMATHVGWRNFWWLVTAMSAICVVSLFFFFPETRFNRPLVYGSTHSPATIRPNEKVDIIADVEREIASNLNAEINGTITDQDPWLGRGRPSKQQWKLCQPYEGNIIKEFTMPWYLHFYPIVEFASFVVSWTASSFLMLNLTQTQAFAAPPYNFDSQTIGFFNFATLIGVLIGLFTAGPLSDWVAAKLTKRNRGIREPEMRLLTMVPYLIILILGNVVTSVGYQHGWDWKAIVIIGYTFIGIQVAALPSIVSTYAVDSYKPVAGSIFVNITVNKNLWGYGFSKFITPWIIESGFIVPLMTNMALTVFWCSFGILFWFQGKTFRKWTRGSKVHSI